MKYKDYQDVLDMLREQHNISIEEFCDGICSVRTYSRYINKGNPMPFSNLVMFVEKLKIPFTSFAVFAMNNVLQMNSDELYLSYYLSLKMYAEAKPLYEKLKGKEFKTIYKDCIIDAYILRMKYEEGDLTKRNYMNQLIH